MVGQSRGWVTRNERVRNLKAKVRVPLCTMLVVVQVRLSGRAYGIFCFIQMVDVSFFPHP